MTLLQKFQENWSLKNFGRSTGRTLVTVSGGIDSMVLACLFMESGIPFGVAHCNFGLRGADSDADEQLVKDWCNLNNITFHQIKFDTKKHTEEWKKGTQETARILRYEWFEQIRSQNGYSYIATAHHANDNVETMLINLFKGTGIAGLHGILPLSNYIIRPLLFATREDISSWAAEKEINYREDASNQTDDYLRNAVRRNIIPAIRQWFPNVIPNVHESITRFGEAELLYRKGIDAERKKLLEKRGQDFYIPILKFRLREPIATICYELIHPFGFTSHQVPHVLNLLDAESGRYITSPSHRIIRNRDFLVITTLPTQSADLVLIETLPCIIDSHQHKYSFSIHDRPKQIDPDPNTALIDMRHVVFPIILRKWKTGDYFYPIGMKMKKKKVSKLLIETKIPLHEKEHLQVLECGKKVAWIPGIRLDERFKIKESTERVLMVRRSAL